MGKDGAEDVIVDENTDGTVREIADGVRMSV